MPSRCGVRIGGHGALHLIDPDGTNRVQLTNPVLADYQPRWARTGSGIVFVRELNPYPNRLTELFVIDANGTGLRQLTAFGGAVFSPTWSPDGSRIAFEGRVLDPNWLDIYSVDAATGGFLVRHTLGGADHISACYSPDGSRLVLASNRTRGPKKLYILELGSGSWFPLTSGTEDDFAPDWR